MDELFESCGLEISSEPNLLVDSCYLFLKNLEDKLTLNDQLSEVVENEFKRICRDEEEKLVLLLSPVESNDASNDSVVQLMLGSRHLQYPAMVTLLELLAEKYPDWNRNHVQLHRLSQTATSCDSLAYSRFTNTQSVNIQNAVKNKTFSIPQLIINHFMWVTQIHPSMVNDEPIAVRISQICNGFSQDLKRAMLHCISVLATDKAYHDVIASRLLELAQDDERLYSEVVQVVSSLSGISIETSLQMRTDVCKKLMECEAAHVPQLVKFILEHQYKDFNAQEVCDALQSLRVSLDMSRLLVSEDSTRRTQGSQQSNSSQQKKVSHVRSLINVLHVQLVQSKALAKTWYELLEDKKCKLMEVDVIVLVIMSELEISPKKLDIFVKQHVKSGQLSGELMRDTLTKYKDLCKIYHQSLLDLLAALVAQNDPNMNEFVIAYASALFTCADVFTRQEIIVLLVTNICTSHEATNTIFGILDSVMSTHISSLRKYSEFFTGLFDQIEHLDLKQIRKLFSLLTALQLKKSSKDSIVKYELYVVIKKQLNVKSERSGKIGVTASFATMSQICKIISVHDDEIYNEQMSNEILEILDSVTKCVSSKNKLMCLYFEEVYELLDLYMRNKCLKVFVERIIQSIMSFAKLFIAKNVQNHLENHSFESIACNFRFNLIDKYQFAFNLPSIIQSQRNKEALSLALPSFVKCLWVVNSSPEGLKSAKSFSKLIGAPFIFPDDKFDSDCNNMNLSTKELNFLCECNLLLVNAIREMLNLTMKTKNVSILEDKSSFLNVSLRLKLLEATQIRFLELLKLASTFRLTGICNPYFLPEKATAQNMKSVCLPHQVSLVPSKQSKTVKTIKKTRKRKLVNNDADEDDGDFENDAMTFASRSEVGTQGPSGVNILTAPCSSDQLSLNAVSLSGTPQAQTITKSAYAAYLRELDLRVFQLLNPKVNKLTPDDYVDQDSLLPPRILLVLLEEFYSKMKFALLGRNEISATNKEKLMGLNINGYFNLVQMSSAEIGTEIRDLFSVLFDVVQAISDHLGSVIQDNNGILDCDDMSSAENMQLTQSFSVIFRIIYSVMNWKLFKEHVKTPRSNEEIPLTLESFLEGISNSHLDVPELVKPSLLDLLDAVKQFFINLNESVTNITTAYELCLLCNLIAKIADESVSMNSSRTALISVDQFEPVADLACLFLKRKWTDCFGDASVSQNEQIGQISASSYNTAISRLSNFYFFGSQNPFRCIERTIKMIAKGVISDLNESSLASTCAVAPFPAVTTESFPAFFRSGWSMLIYFSKKIPLINKKDCLKKDPQSVNRRNFCMQEWFKCVKCLYTCLKVAKLMKSRLIFNPIIRGSIALMEQFVKKAIPLLEITFKLYVTDVKAMLRNIRECSQDLQIVCTHSKVTNDLSLMRNVPKLRKNLESLLYNIKSVFAYHGCLDQFSMVPLRNRALNGEEIFSQRDLPNESVTSIDENELSDDDGNASDSNDVTNSRNEMLSSQVLRERNNHSDGSSDADSFTSSNNQNRADTRQLVLSEAESEVEDADRVSVTAGNASVSDDSNQNVSENRSSNRKRKSTKVETSQSDDDDEGSEDSSDCEVSNACASPSY